jgi:hypothetical protein
VGLAKDAVGGTVGLAREFGSGLVSLLTPQQRAQYARQQGQQGQQGQQAPIGTRTQYNEMATTRPVSNDFSHQGALPAKQPSNFIPITANFSSFGK